MVGPQEDGGGWDKPAEGGKARTGRRKCGRIARRDKAAILERLRACEPELKSLGVAHAALFGSHARGEERADSDIDILDCVGIVRFIEQQFPAPVDIANRAGLKPLVRPAAERDAIYAF